MSVEKMPVGNTGEEGENNEGDGNKNERDFNLRDVLAELDVLRQEKEKILKSRYKLLMMDIAGGTLVRQVDGSANAVANIEKVANLKMKENGSQIPAPILGEEKIVWLKTAIQNGGSVVAYESDQDGDVPDANRGIITSNIGEIYEVGTDQYLVATKKSLYRINIRKRFDKRM